MRRNTLINLSVPALVLAALVLALGCAGGERSARRPPPPLTLDQRIDHAKTDVLEGEGHIEQLERDLKKTKEKVWTPPPGIAAPQSLQDSINRVEWLEKQVHGAKRQLQRNKKRLDDLIKEKEGNKGGEGGGC